MKKSGVMLLGAAGIIFIILLTLIITFRISADKFVTFANDPNQTVEPSGVEETRSFSFTGFNKLHFENVWDVVISESEQYSISITADKSLLDQLKLRENGKILNFSYDKYLNVGSGSDYALKVNITMPEIKSIQSTGMGNIILKDFNIDKLEILNSGASNIEANNVTIEQLNLIISGAANAQLSDIEIRNCDLDVSGAAKIKLNMTGGNLTGQVSGAASVIYTGNVANQTVKVSGIGSVEQK